MDGRDAPFESTSVIYLSFDSSTLETLLFVTSTLVQFWKTHLMGHHVNQLDQMGSATEFPLRKSFDSQRVFQYCTNVWHITDRAINWECIESLRFWTFTLPKLENGSNLNLNFKYFALSGDSTQVKFAIHKPAYRFVTMLHVDSHS